MNNSKMKWPLLILCIGVWVAVFYVLFGNKEKAVTPIIVKKQEINIPQKESYSLSMSYADPFLKGGLSRKKAVISTPQTSYGSPSVSRSILDQRVNRPTSRKRKKVIFPEIKYKGYVKKTASAGLVSVDFEGEAIHWEKGTKIDDVYLMDIYLDSIRIQKGGQRKTIKR